MTNTEDLLKKLISIPSPTGSESEVCNFMLDLLNKEGFKTSKYEVGNERFNIVANIGNNPRVYLQAHLDTVPGIIEYSEDDENIYGRGACDTKGSVACMVSAAISCKKQGYKNFGLIFTVGEETDFDGAKKIIQSNFPIPFVIVGEPSSLQIVNEHFGILVIKITAKGKAAHSSKPDEGINAIDKLLETIEKVKSLKIHPNTLMSLVLIDGGVADNVIPGLAQATFSFRVSPDDKNDYTSQIKAFSTANISVEETLKLNSVHTDVPKELSFIKEKKTVKYSTELSFFQKGVVIGPGDIKYAHGPNEQLPKIELKKAVEVYSQIIKNFG